MVYHFIDSGIVRHHKALKAPLVTQHISHQPFTGCSRNAIHFIKGSHHTTHSGINSCLIGEHVLIEHALTAHIHRVIIASGLGSSIQGEMLDTSHYLIIAFHLAALIATHHGFSYLSTQERVFPTPFRNTSPTGIPADIYHRTESPGNTIRTGLNGRNTGRFLNGFHIPGT